GLDGAQAAWAARKYKGHRILPPEFLKEMEAAGIGREGMQMLVCRMYVVYLKLVLQFCL
ncbi:hypothetical protein B0H13DRAFT_1604009, partial [Mycena leptocephala]